MAFDKSALKDYVDVAERIRAWYEAYPNARIETRIIEHNEKRVVIEARAYRGVKEDNGLDEKLGFVDDRPAGIGHSAMQIPGATPYTRGSEIENCETSAVGRALVMAGLPSKRIASDDEIKSKGGSTKPTAKSVAEVFPAEDVVLPEHVQKFMDGLDAAKTLDELTTIGRNINESNLNGQEIDDVHREDLLKKFKARRGEIAS
jgi:hypothetical protein